jgi:chromosome segregation ATPase
MQKASVLFASLAVADAAAGDNPLAAVLELMDECSAKVKADGEAEAKAYAEYVEWCDDVAANTQFEIKTAQAEKDKLEAKIGQLTADIEVANSNIESLTASVAAAEKELADATGVREKEAADFAAGEGELVDTVDTLGRAIGILEREAAKNPAAFNQIDTTNMNSLTQALSSVIDAAAFTASDRKKLTALVQSHNSDDDDDSEYGAPAAASYKSHSGSIVDLLADMKEKAEGELSDLRKAEGAAKQNFAMLKGSLEGEIGADTKDLNDNKNGLAAATEDKAASEGDLSGTTKDLAESKSDLATASANCMTTAADHEATVAARKEELEVIAHAKSILEETTAGAVGQSYSFLQIATKVDLRNMEVVTAVQQLAKKQHSAALNQLASRIQAVIKYGNGSGADVFGKIKGLISDMITKLEGEAESDATEKAYCDEEMAKTESKKAELDSTMESLTTKIDRAASKSAGLKEDVKELQGELAALAKETAEMDQMRNEQNADYRKAKADLELGLGGVQKALGVLRDYYAGAAAASLVQDDSKFGSLMQQPAMPEKHTKSSGAGGSIINILEVCESDFSNNLAKEESQEADAQSQYEKTTQSNKISKATKEQDVKYKTQEFKGLDKEISELSSDKSTTGTELAAVNEYYGKIKDRCIAKPETYEERTKRREAEIDGLKQALSILEEETAFVQRKKHGSQHFLG